MSGRVLCAGHVNWDVTLSVDRLPDPDGEAAIVDQHESGGGSAANTAIGLACLGSHALLLGSVGADRHGSLLSDELVAAGVDCSLLEHVPGPTTVKYLVVDERGEVMVLANDGANERFDPSAVDEETLAAVAHLHLTSQRPQTAHTLATRARSAGVPVSFDPGRRLDARAYGRIYPLVDTVFVNESEAAALDRQLPTDWGGLQVIKRGGDGAEAIRGSERVSHAGFDADAVDTAGAGDAFAAGFIAAQTEGESLEQALAVGNACGALAAQSAGARTRLSWDELEQMIGPRG